MDSLHMVPLATTQSGFEARVLAARLGAEGIVWQLRGGDPDGVYPLGDVEVLVTADDFDRACEMLASDDVGDADDARDGHDHTEWWMAAGIVVLLVVFIGLRVFTL